MKGLLSNAEQHPFSVEQGDWQHAGAGLGPLGSLKQGHFCVHLGFLSCGVFFFLFFFPHPWKLTGAPYPSVVSGVAVSTQGCSSLLLVPETARGWGRHRVLCVIQQGLCLSASAREELRDNTLNAVPFIALSRGKTSS